MDPRYIKKHTFFKVLIWSNSYNQVNTIKALQAHNYDVYVANSKEEAKHLLSIYNISLLIIHISYINDIKTSIPIILLVSIEELKLLNHISHEQEVIDYFIMPIHNDFFMRRVNFFLQQQGNIVHLTEKTLSTYLWEAKLYQEDQLHNLIWKNNYNHYVLTKLSQFSRFFSTILCLVEDFYKDSIPFETIMKNIINSISLQMCFFNCYVTFSFRNRKFPSSFNLHGKHFLLFLISICELCKSNSINGDILLDFTKNEREYMVTIEMPTVIGNLVKKYNDMNLDNHNLFHFLQKYLWQHWKKKVHLLVKSGNISVIEIFLKNKN